MRQDTAFSAPRHGYKRWERAYGAEGLSSHVEEYGIIASTHWIHIGAGTAKSRYTCLLDVLVLQKACALQKSLGFSRFAGLRARRCVLATIGDLLSARPGGRCSTATTIMAVQGHVLETEIKLSS